MSRASALFSLLFFPRPPLRPLQLVPSPLPLGDDLGDRSAFVRAPVLLRAFHLRLVPHCGSFWAWGVPGASDLLLGSRLAAVVACFVRVGSRPPSPCLVAAGLLRTRSLLYRPATYLTWRCRPPEPTVPSSFRLCRKPRPLPTAIRRSRGALCIAARNHTSFLTSAADFHTGVFPSSATQMTL